MTPSDRTGQIRHALINAKNSDVILTFEAPGRYRSWVQVIDTIVNACYPFADHPGEVIRGLAPFSKKLRLCIDEWTPRVNVHLSFEVCDPDTLAQWIDEYFVRVLDCDAATYDLVVTVAQVDAENSGEPVGSTCFHPGRSYFDDGGVIVIPAGGYAPNFGIWDGTVIVERSHANYGLWLWIRSQEKYQSEDAMVTDRDLEALRREFLAAQAKQGENA